MRRLQIDPVTREVVTEFYATYHHTLEKKQLMDWVALLAPDISYRVTSLENVERGWPLCFVRCDNQSMALDRATALQDSIYFRDRVQQHIVSSVQITRVDSEDSHTLVSASTSLAVNESINGQEATLLVTAKTLDVLRIEANHTVLQERMCVCDPDIISDSLVFPL